MPKRIVSVYISDDTKAKIKQLGFQGVSHFIEKSVEKYSKMDDSIANIDLAMEKLKLMPRPEAAERQRIFIKCHNELAATFPDAETLQREPRLITKLFLAYMASDEPKFRNYLSELDKLEKT